MWRNEAEDLKTKPKRKKSSNHFDWKELWENNHPDIWFDSNNRPQSAEECKHLREAIETRRRVGKYFATNYTTKSTKRQLLLVQGPMSWFAIESEYAKSRFIKKLDEVEASLKPPDPVLSWLFDE